MHNQGTAVKISVIFKYQGCAPEVSVMAFSHGDERMERAKCCWAIKQVLIKQVLGGSDGAQVQIQVGFFPSKAGRLIS